MKAFWIVLIVLLIAALIVWVRAGAGFHVLHTLPLLGGARPSWLWDGAAVVMLAIAVWGIWRVIRIRNEP